MKPQYYKNLKTDEVFVFSSVFTLEGKYCFGEKMSKKFPDLTLEEIPFRKSRERPGFVVEQIWNKNIYLRKVAPEQIVYSLGDGDTANAILDALSLVEYFRRYKDYQDWHREDSTEKNTLFHWLRHGCDESGYSGLKIPEETNPRHILTKGVMAMEELYQGRLDNLSWKMMFSWMKILSMQENLLWWIRSFDWPAWVPLGDRFLTITLFELGQKNFFSALTELQKRPDINETLPYILLWDEKGIRTHFTSPYIQEDSTACQWFSEMLLKDTRMRLKNEDINWRLLRARAKEMEAIARKYPNPLCPATQDSSAMKSPRLERVS